MVTSASVVASSSSDTGLVDTTATATTEHAPSVVNVTSMDSTEDWIEGALIGKIAR